MQSPQADPVMRYFPFFFIVMWAFLSVLIAHIGGWSQLSEYYRTDQPFSGKIRRWQSGSMRWGTNYGNCLNIGANSEGLYLSVMFLFRTGHPPLFIPWEDISVEERTTWGIFRTIRLTFSKAPGIPLDISPRFVDKIKTEAGERWPNPSDTTAI